MNEKSQLMNALKELTEKRLLTSEAESLFEPYKDATLPLSLSFLSATKSFGSQKDETYNDGYSVICNTENWGIEICLLFPSQGNSLVESLESGDVFEANVKFIDYDALYQRAIFGKLYSESDFHEVPESAMSSLPDDATYPIDLEAQAIDLEAQAIELEAQAIELEAEIIGAESDLIEHTSDIAGSKSEARLLLLKSLNSRKKLIEQGAERNKHFSKADYREEQSNLNALPQPSQLEKSGCWCLLLGVFVSMGSIISLGDGFDSFGFLVIGLTLCVVGGLSLLISKSTKNRSGKS